MKVLSTRINHIFYTHFTTDNPGTITICQCPASIVWEIHNLTFTKIAGGVSTFSYVIIKRNGVGHKIDSYKGADIGPSACRQYHEIIYMKPGDVLQVQVNAWVNYLTFQIAYGVLEHRDH